MLKRIAIVALFVTSTAEAKQRRPHPPVCSDRAKSDCEAPREQSKRRQSPHIKTITIGDPLSLDGKLHGMALLYFIESANEELERSALPTKSFVPRIVQSVEEEAL